MKVLVALAACVGTLVFALSARADHPSWWFTSPDGDEYTVSFDSLFVARATSRERVLTMTAEQRTLFTDKYILPGIDFLFGPLTARDLGSPQRLLDISVDWDRVTDEVTAEGRRTLIPYHYRGLWILDSKWATSSVLQLPVPLNPKNLYTPHWKLCTDSAPEYQTKEFYSDFWDPARKGCDQRAEVHYRLVDIHLEAKTPNQLQTFPEYTRMLADGEMKLTLAFGYDEDPARPQPDKDDDLGAGEYRGFLKRFRKKWGRELTETPIVQTEYLSGKSSRLVVGHRFTGVKEGIKVTVNLVINAGLDQMELFAKSFAHDHDDAFAWFGHSREGQGFEEGNFAKLVAANPAYYSVTDAFQLIYWDSCNSYTYYTYPFFKFKGGSKNLDIISNGLPVIFGLAGANADYFSHALLNWKEHLSYQEILGRVRANATSEKTKVLVSVAGDEDNDEH